MGRPIIGLSGFSRFIGVKVMGPPGGAPEEAGAWVGGPMSFMGGATPPGIEPEEMSVVVIVVPAAAAKSASSGVGKGSTGSTGMGQLSPPIQERPLGSAKLTGSPAAY